jgi:hypothetical protein
VMGCGLRSQRNGLRSNDRVSEQFTGRVAENRGLSQLGRLLLGSRFSPQVTFGGQSRIQASISEWRLATGAYFPKGFRGQFALVSRT